MKTSNKFLIALFTIFLFAIVGTNLVLKAEYEKIDKNDPFYGYSDERTEPYSVILLKGNGKGLIRIQPGESFGLRVKEEYKNQVSWTLRNDTLELSLMPEKEPFFTGEVDRYSLKGEVYIVQPNIKTVYTENVRTTITDWKDSSLKVFAEGPKGGLFLQNNTFSSVSADVREGGLLKTGTNNEVRHMEIKIGKNSSFEAEKDVFHSLEVTADSLASFKIPGSLLQEIAQNNLLKLQ